MAISDPSSAVKGNLVAMLCQVGRKMSSRVAKSTKKTQNMFNKNRMEVIPTRGNLSGKVRGYAV